MIIDGCEVDRKIEKREILVRMLETKLKPYHIYLFGFTLFMFTWLFFPVPDFELSPFLCLPPSLIPPFFIPPPTLLKDKKEGWRDEGRKIRRLIKWEVMKGKKERESKRKPFSFVIA